MPISVARAKTLCSASELALVKSSARQEIAKLSAPKLRLSVERARKLRDKWRDQANAQRRKSQKELGARETDGNARTAEKAQLFDEVLERFTARLATMDTTEIASKPRAGAKRFARSQSHRATRAELRGSLQEAKRELTSPTKKKLTNEKVAAAIPSSTASAPVADAPSVAPKKAVKSAATSAQPRKPRKAPATDMSAIDAGRATQRLRVTKQQQLLAKTSAKQGHLKAAGLVRIQKNRSAANKRSQARRDSR
jgi:hypothetical protein